MKKLSQKIVKLLKKKKLKISFAESCTGGMLASAITSVSGSSKVFSMGLVTYSNQSKNRLLKVTKQVIKKHGAVSFQCCLSMANNLKKISKSDIVVSVTGVAGPTGGSKQKPIGLVYIGIVKKKRVFINKCKFLNKGRLYIQKSAVKKTLNLLLKLIK